LNHEGVIMAEAKKTTTKAKKVNAKATEEKKKLKTIKEQTENIVSQETPEIVEEKTVEDTAEKSRAKAGKRSPKAVKEIEEKEAKELRKTAVKVDNPEQEPKKTLPKTRSKLERRSKAYKKAYELIDSTQTYELKDALGIAVKTSIVKFDATVELHINLNVDPRQADQNIRGTVVLPAGTGKSARIAVFADDEDAKKAKTAGADIASGDEFLKQLDKGTLDFDVLISTPTNMAKLGKYARLLGPKGLMPNPKSGTVTTDVVKAVEEAKAGKVEYRVDSTGIIHVGVGKVSFGEDKLEQNSQAIISSIKSAKPASIKGVYIKSAYVTTSMGPSLKTTI
jgi:large subunit ribosomal protein L1